MLKGLLDFQAAYTEQGNQQRLFFQNTPLLSHSLTDFDLLSLLSWLFLGELLQPILGHQKKLQSLETFGQS